MRGTVKIITLDDEGKANDVGEFLCDLSLLNNMAFAIAENNSAGYRMNVGSVAVLDDALILSGVLSGAVTQWHFTPPVMGKV